MFACDAVKNISLSVEQYKTAMVSSLVFRELLQLGSDIIHERPSVDVIQSLPDLIPSSGLWICGSLASNANSGS